MRVRFVTYDGPFEVGDEKECTEGEAAKLVRNGVAVDASEPVPEGCVEVPPVDGFQTYAPKPRLGKKKA